MRELYALGQTIDLLRAGKLPEAAIAVHLAEDWNPSRRPPQAPCSKHRSIGAWSRRVKGCTPRAGEREAPAKARAPPGPKKGARATPKDEEREKAVVLGRTQEHQRREKRILGRNLTRQHPIINSCNKVDGQHRWQSPGVRWPLPVSRRH
jgi:hypothetical protein